MITKALALVFVLTVIQLGRDCARGAGQAGPYRIGRFDSLGRSGAGTLNETAEASCCRGHNLSSGITFVPRLDGPIHTCRGTGIGFNPSSALLFRNCLGGRKPCSVHISARPKTSFHEKEDCKRLRVRRVGVPLCIECRPH
jgi:hypothetical protein